MSPFKSIAIAASALTALLIAACGDAQVAGTSSGVDNPSLTVGFRNGSGSALRVTGDLNVYSLEQNPALDAEPIMTIKVKNSSFTNLTGADFARLQAASKLSAGGLSKTTAGTADSVSISFNIILKTQERTGSLVLGFKYDSASRVFSRVGGEVLSRVDVQPKPLIRYEAKIAREGLHGDAGRIFVPGTPYLATLVDSVFVIEDLPEGVFPIRLLAADGKVYPIGDSLDTKDTSRIYHPLPTPVGEVDSAAGKDSVPEFGVMAGVDHEGLVEVTDLLEAKMVAVDLADRRLSFLWRLLKEAGDSGRADTLFHDTLLNDSLTPPKPGPVRSAEIRSPTSTRTEIRYGAEGVYRFEFRATLGLRTRSDTVTVSVRRLPPTPLPRVIQPVPGDSLVIGKAYNIQWEMPDMGMGPVTVQLSLEPGGKWIDLAQHYKSESGLPILTWVPDKTLAAPARCMIQVKSEADTSIHARMEGFFNLLP